MVIVGGTLVALLIIGIPVGLWAIHGPARWCPECGRSLACPDRRQHELDRARAPR